MLRLVPTRAGCEGCYYQEEAFCPGFSEETQEFTLEACQLEDGMHGIFIEEDSDESRV